MQCALAAPTRRVEKDWGFTAPGFESVGLEVGGEGLGPRLFEGRTPGVLLSGPYTHVIQLPSPPKLLELRSLSLGDGHPVHRNKAFDGQQGFAIGRRHSIVLPPSLELNLGVAGDGDEALPGPRLGHVLELGDDAVDGREDAPDGAASVGLLECRAFAPCHKVVLVLPNLCVGACG